MEQRTFTFGGGQVNPKNGESLRNKFVTIEGETSEHCRLTMLRHFDRNWAFEYPTPERAGVHEFNLTELPRDEWPSVAYDLYRLDACGHVIYTRG